MTTWPAASIVSAGSKPAAIASGGVDGDDVAAVDRDGAGRQDARRPVHGDHDAAGDDERDGPARGVWQTSDCGGGQAPRSTKCASIGRVILSPFLPVRLLPCSRFV